MDGASMEMPKYKCHKIVHALKIAGLAPTPPGPGNEPAGSVFMLPAEKGYARFVVDYSYVAKHNPQVGGYYVVYGDGYKSYSPAEAFEGGYTMMD